MDHPATQPGPNPDADRSLGELRRLRALLKTLLVSRALLVIVSVVLGALIVGGVLDYLLRPPAPVRWVGWIGACVCLVWLVRRVLMPPVRFKPSLTTVALRALENRETGERVASGVDLTREHAPEGELEGAIRTTGIRGALAGTFARRAVRWREWARPAVLALSLVALSTLITTQWPTSASTALTRLTMPWSDAQWPRRFPVIDLTRVAVHPTDASLPVRAAVVRPSGTSAGMVEAHYRFVRGEGLLARPGPERRLTLTDQGRPVQVLDGQASGEGAPPPPVGTLFERLIEPAALAPAATGSDAVFIEYWITTRDDRTESRRVRLVNPPALERATIAVTPPPYAIANAAEGGIAEGTTTIEDEHTAAAGPILAGSRVAVDLAFNKPLPIGEDPAWLGALRAAADGPVSFSTSNAGTRLEATLARSAIVPIEIRDAYEIAPRDPITLALDVIDDEAPEAAVTAPSHDESVLASAVVAIGADGRDDLGVARVEIEHAVARPPAGSVGAPPEPGDAVVFADSGDAPAQRQMNVTATLDLATLALAPGDEVRLTALVTDTYAAALGGRDATRSRTRTLRVIDAGELVEQIRGELAGLRRTVVRLDEEQGELERLADSPEANTAAERQEGLSSRIGTQERLVDRLRERQSRNGLDDPSLQGQLGDAGALLEAARNASDQAAAAESRVESSAPDSPERAQAERDAEDSRSTVRDNLGRLAELLDRGEDGWLVRRSFERLLDEQRRLREETASVASETVGKTMDQLDPRERSALERIAQRQQDAAEQAASAIDELGERADQLSEADPGQAAAMESAASKARKQQLAEKLDDAAEQLGQNQTGLAQEAQDEAIEALEDLLEQLDEADRAKDAALRRQLASLVQSIESLVRRQERELQRLETGEPIASLDRGLIELNRNTLAVRAESATEPSLAPVTDLLARAGGAQSDAITLMRAGEPNAEEIDRRERASLLALRRALDEAQQRLDEAEQAEADRIRQEVRQAYRAALEEQAALLAETDPLAGKRLSRRERAHARTLGAKQDELRTRVAQIPEMAGELAEARVFAFAHRRLDRLMTDAADALGAGSPNTATRRAQTGAVDLLASLVDALSDPEQPDSPFDDGQQADSGQSQGGQGGEGSPPPPLVPPVAELKVLRTMQQQAMMLTRELDESPDARTPDGIAEAAQLQTDLASHAAELIQRMQQPPAMPEGVITEPDSAPGPENEQDTPGEGSEPGEPAPDENQGLHGGGT